MNYNKEKKAAMAAAEMAGKKIAKYFAKIDSLKIGKKSKHEVLTPADLDSNRTIINFLHQHFPGYGVLSEESGQDRARPEYLWIIDPLDGTTNFSLGNPFFNVSIALAHHDKIVVGVVHSPFLKQTIVAEIGRGATMNGKKIYVSGEKKLENCVVDFGYSYSDAVNQKMNGVYANLMNKLEHTRNMGAAALEIAWVGLGRLEGYIHFDVHLWDVAAGVLIVREAGGKATDFSGQEFNLKSKTLLASNGKAHEKILRLIK
jgi:myo-inositol-1(or 4)-monophosphatase